MSEPGGIFLSAVTSEFGSARTELARYLRKKRYEVILQEEFELQPNSTIEKLDHYINRATAVVAVVGRRSGSPPPSLPKGFRKRVPKPLRKVGDAKWSYTQWEIFLAHHKKKPVFAYLAEESYKPDKKKIPKGDNAKLQKRIKDWLFEGKRGKGLDRVPFSNNDQLTKEVLATNLPTSLKGAGRGGTSGREGSPAREERSGVPRPMTEDEHPRLRTRSPLIGRGQALEQIEQAIRKAAEPESLHRLVLLVGDAGMGRRSLLQSLSQDREQCLPHFEDGVAVAPLFTGEDNLEDLLQAIWEAFFVVDDPSTVMPRRRRVDLNKLNALVFVDPSAGIEALLNRLPELMPHSVICAAVLPDDEPHLHGDVIHVKPLSEKDAWELFLARYEGTMSESERDRYKLLCVGAGGHPQSIEKLAGNATRETQDKGDVAAQALSSGEAKDDHETPPETEPHP